MKVNDIEKQERMEGIGSGAKNEIFNLWIASVITPVMTIDGEGIIWIRNELRNRENNSKSLAANQNDLDNRQSQDSLTVLVAQAEFYYNIIKFLEQGKCNLDVRDEELMQMVFGAVKGSQANISKVEQSRLVDKPKVDSRLLSRVKEEEDDRSNRQKVKMSRKQFGDDFVNLSRSNFDTI